MSVCAFWFVVLATKKLKKIYALKRSDQSSTSAQRWPKEFRPLESVWSVIARFAGRFIHPSSVVRQVLLAIAIDGRFDDREFSKFQFAAMSLAVLTASLIALVILASTAKSDFTLLLSFVGVAALIGFYLPRVRLHDRYRESRRRMTRVFPSFLDVLVLTLESGLNFQSALQLAAQRLPSSEAGLSLRVQLDEILRDIRSGEHRLAALQKFADRLALPQVTQFVASVTAAERQGVSVSTLLRRQAEQLRTSRALSAERHAMKMPVKLLAPLAICIFPCTFLILAFPLSVRLMGSGLF